MNVLQQAAQAITGQRLLPSGQLVLVAVSGGLDSMVLLDVLHRLAGDRQWQLTVAHFNHQLRGRSSDADERLVRRTAKQLGLPCAVGRADVSAHARRHKLSVEMAARHLRHRFLARTARRRGMKTIALAHQADDQVELFFLRLLRGAGADGLAGMKWRSPSPEDPQLTLIRPLLGQPKTALSDYARERRISHREDASNAALDAQRNRLRHQLLPLLRRHFQPALTQVVRRHMELLSAEADYLNQVAQAWLDQSPDPPFDRLAPAIQRRVLRRQLIVLGLDVDFDLVEHLRMQADRPVIVQPRLVVLRNVDGGVRTQPVAPLRFQSQESWLALDGTQGQAEFGGLTLRWQRIRRSRKDTPQRMVGCEWYDAGRVGSPVLLRHWRPGDRFQPSGLPAAAKLQDLFTNLKVPPAERRARIVATTVAGDIWWVEGLRIGERFKLVRETVQRLKWRWRRLAQ